MAWPLGQLRWPKGPAFLSTKSKSWPLAWRSQANGQPIAGFGLGQSQWLSA